MADNKLKSIKEFMDGYIASSKVRGRMYGSPTELESQWWVLDQIFFIVEGISEENQVAISWGTFLATKGFSARSASSVIVEKGDKSPYETLTKLRNEYEAWRTQKIAGMATK